MQEEKNKRGVDEVGRNSQPTRIGSGKFRDLVIGDLSAKVPNLSYPYILPAAPTMA